MTPNEEWGNALCVGDEVAQFGSGWNRNVSIQKVQRVTDTLVIIAGRKYRKQGGWEIGNRYGSHIAPVTQEIRDEISDRDRRSVAMRLDISTHTRRGLVRKASCIGMCRNCGHRLTFCGKEFTAEIPCANCLYINIYKDSRQPVGGRW